MFRGDALSDRWALEDAWKTARAARFHFSVVRKGICLEAFMVSFLFCAVLPVPFFFRVWLKLPVLPLLLLEQGSEKWFFFDDGKKEK